MNGLRPPRGGVRRELSSSLSGSRLPALGAGSPVRFVVRGKFGPGWLRRHLPPDVGLRPVRTQEAAGLSSDCWKAHLQAPAKSSSYKTVVVFNYCVDTGNDFVKIWLDVCLSKIWIFWLRVLIDICVCNLLHAMVALLQQGCLAKRCKYGRIFCMYTHPDSRANILPCPPIQKGGEWSWLASAHFHIGSRGQ